MLPRDNEDVDGRLRLEVSERVTVLILVDGFGGDASVDDLAENATHVEKSTGVRIRLPGIGDACGLSGLDSKLRSPLPRQFFSGIEEPVNRLCNSAVKGSNAGERYFNEPVFTGLLHQLGDSVCRVDVHHNKQTLRAGDAYDLTKLRETTEDMI